METEQECLLALRKGMIHPDYTSVDFDNPSGDRVPFFHYLVERDYTTAVNYVLAKPENCKKYINLSANGKTALDLVISSKMETLLRARGAKLIRNSAVRWPGQMPKLFRLKFLWMTR